MQCKVINRLLAKKVKSVGSRYQLVRDNFEGDQNKYVINWMELNLEYKTQ